MEENCTSREIQRQYDEIERQIAALSVSPLTPKDRAERRMELHQQKLALLPQIAFQCGQPYAEVLEHAYPWDRGAPLPHVLSDGISTYLAYILSDHASVRQDEVTVLNEEKDCYHCALVRFECAVDYRFGGANDEVLGGHPLQGLAFYRLHRVHHSPWIAELQAINARHTCYDPSWWSDLQHYFFTFHDQTFECIAKSFATEVFRGVLRDVMKLAFDRVFG